MTPALALGVAALAASVFARGADGVATPAPAPEPVPFSSLAAGHGLAPWAPVSLGRGKRPTHYELAQDAGAVVLHAVADNAARALAQEVAIDVHRTPMMAWRWKIAGLIPGADPNVASREDAPARIVLEFDGDRSRLSLADRALSKLCNTLFGRPLPYAAIVYIWAGSAPVGTVIPNPYTGRVKMIVASSGAGGVRTWQSLTRDVAADFRLAFDENPGRLTSVGVLTDSDNTESRAEAWYGDIAFAGRPSP